MTTKYKGVLYTVDSNGTLTMMRPMEESDTVYIPHELPNGDKIRSLGTRFCVGSYNKIVVSDEVKKIGPRHLSTPLLILLFGPKAVK